MWWAAVDRKDWPGDPEYRKLIEWKQVENFDDRCQELVFIRICMDQGVITATMEACMLTDAEMVPGERAWQVFPDPFPQWTKMEED